jgi:hypothetical protein
VAASPPPDKPDSRHAHIEAIIHGGGQIMIGTIQPIRGAAIAHDGTKTLVMLRVKRAEPLDDLLARLDQAIATARATGQRVDDVNRPSSTTTYEF